MRRTSFIEPYLRIVFSILLLGLAVNQIFAQELIIPKESEWKFDDTGRNLGTGWSSLLFNDDSWDSGNGILGYGEVDLGTEVSYGSDRDLKYMTTYFRKSFVVSGAGQYHRLLFSLLRDDGAVVYLNGQLLFTSNMPESFDYSTPSIESVGGDEERTYYDYIADSEYLIDGLNVLGVEVHQTDPGSSDLSFDLEMSLSTESYGELRINEICPRNVSNFIDPDYNQFQDWIELYNPKPEELDISGYYLTDNLNIPNKWQFPTGSKISGNGFFVVSADGLNEGLHTSFRLSGTGEKLAIFNTELEMIDSLSYPNIYPNESFGILSDGSKGYFGEVSPDKTNGQGYTQALRAAPAQYSLNGGFYSGSISLNLISSEAGAQIRYTLNGEDVDSNSDLFSSAIQISSNKVVKTRVYIEGRLPSSTSVQSYFINRNHDLPVFSLTTDPDFLDDSDVGIYREDNLPERKLWDRPGTLEFFDENGAQEFLINIDFRLFGRGAIYFPQKSLAIFMRMTNEYDGLNYSLFPNSPVNHFQSFILRSSSDDWRNTMFRDGMIHSLLVDKMDLEYMDYRPSVLYINGKYYGIHNIRDKLNESYLATHKGVDPSNVDLLFVDNDYNPPEVEIKSGDNVAYWAMFDFITNNDMSKSQNYEKAGELIDLNNYLDYLCVQIIVGNRSWLHNRRVWRPKTPNGKFRYMLFDTDYGYYDLNEDVFKSLRSKDKIFSSLLSNSKFKAGLIQKLALHSQIIFEKNRVEQIINQIAAVIESEIPRHAEKWGPTFSGNFDNKSEWVDKVDRMLAFNSGRANKHENYIQDYLSDVGRIDFKLTSTSVDAGSVYCQDVKIKNTSFDGYLYKNKNVYLKAEPKPGYVFSGWSGSGIENQLVSGYDWEISGGKIKNLEIVLKGSGDIDIKANYSSPKESSLVITELFYMPDFSQGGDDAEFIEIKNTGSQSQNIGGYYIANAIDFVFPSNSVIDANEVIIVAKEPARYQGLGIQVFDWDDGRLTDGGEEIEFRNSASDLLDKVDYLAVSPWPSNVSGYSIELSNYSLDNDVGLNWQKTSVYGGTPGIVNLKFKPNLVVNEIVGMSSDQEYLGNSDWIEIYNAGESSVDLAGLYITDEKTNPYKYLIPSGFPVLTTVAPGSYIVFIAEGQPEIGPTHTNFRISGASGYVGLYSAQADGSFDLIDGVDYPGLENAKSYGRSPNGYGDFEVLEPSPASYNSNPEFHIIAPELVAPGELLPVIIRITDDLGEIDRSIVETIQLKSSVGTLEPNLVDIRNGVGSITVKFTANNDFDLSIEGYDYSRRVRVSSSIPEVKISGNIDEPLTLLGGISYLIDNSITFSDGGAFIAQAGARVILGSKANIHLDGKFEFNGTLEKPIVFMPRNSASPWGGMDLENVTDTCKISYTFFIYGSGDAAKLSGHSDSQPLFKIENIIANLDNCYMIDNVGKAMRAQFCRISIKNSVFSRLDTGPELEFSYGQVYDSWFNDLPDTDKSIIDNDNDALYFEGIYSSSDPPSIVDGCVIYGTEDDGIDTSAADLIVRNSIFSRNYEKGISAGYRSNILVENCLFYRMPAGITSSFWSPIVIDHCTFVRSGRAVFSTYAGGTVSNSIFNDHSTTYSKEGDNLWYFSYCLSDSDPNLLGKGNTFGEPGFLDADNKDYRLGSGSLAIDAGDPGYKKDPDGSITDVGAYPYGLGLEGDNALVISELHYNPQVTTGISEQYEFIELINTGSIPLNVSSYRIDDAISFSFPANTILEPGEIVVLAYEKLTYASLDVRVFEWSEGKLSNGGELISLYSSAGKLIDQVLYDDATPWPTAADGVGYSLELSNLKEDNYFYNFWTTSQAYGGSPGESYQEIDYSKVKINEVFFGSLGDSDTGTEYPWIEIYNQNVNSLSVENHRFVNDLGQIILLSGDMNWSLAGPNGFISIALNPLHIQSVVAGFVNLASEISFERFNGLEWILVDKVTIPTLTEGNSYGRYPDGYSELSEFSLKTPGQSNTIGSGNIITTRRIVSGDVLPVIVRLDGLDQLPDYLINMDITLSSQGANLSPDSFALVQGTGAMMTSASADESFILEIDELDDTVGISVASMRHRFDIEKKINFDQTWTSEHDYYIDNDMVIQTGVTLTINQGARVFISSKGKIIVEGKLLIYGTPADPVFFSSSEEGRPWGNIEFPKFSGGGELNGVIFNNGGGDSDDYTGYTNSQAIIETNGTNITMNNCFFVDNPGKAVYASGADIIFKNSLVSESETGVIVQDGTLQVNRSSFQFIPDKNPVYTGEEHDALFISTSTSGGTSRISNSKFNHISDDAITAYSATWLGMSNLFFNFIGDKAATIYDSPADISYVVVSNSQTAISVRGDSEARIDHGTFHQNNVHLKSYASSDGSASSDLSVVNCILSNSTSADYYKDNDSSIEFEFSLSNQDDHDGPGNLFASPGFQDALIGDFRLGAGSPAVNTGDPDSPLDNDGSRTDMGAFTGSELFSSVLVINEIMYAPNLGGTSGEFIEIYNAGGDDVALTNYVLSSAIDFVFPVGSIIQPGEYILIARNASDYISQGYQVYEWSAGDLGDSGDNINLFDPDGKLVDVVNYSISGDWPSGTIGSDLSIELSDPGMNNSSPRSWHYSYVYGGTPGKENSRLSSEGLVLNELMARNNSTIQDETGQYVDWLEIFNSSNQFASLQGYYLSNDQDNLQLYQLSGSKEDLMIPPQSYAIFWLDKLPEKGLYHTNFDLAAASGYVALSKLNGTSIELIDETSYTGLGTDIPYGRSPNGRGDWSTLSQPTPGSSNDVVITPIAGLFINEVLARNTSVYPNDIGEFDDWIELYNQTLQPIDVGGLYISDDPSNPLKFKIPSGHPEQTTIQSRGFLMLFPTAKPEVGPRHLNFQLAGGGEHIKLTQILFSEEILLDEVEYPALSSNESWGRVLDAYNDWQLFEEPTPNSSNGYNSVENITKSKTNVTVYPNPVSENLTVSLTSDEEFEYTIEVMSLLSQNLRLIGKGSGNSAFSTVLKSYNISELDGGNSFVILRIRINDEVFSRRIYLLKD